jgi:Activator of Hsp90 ATPase homolog 1-like protein
MQKLKFSIEINSPKEKVWNTMLEDKTYRIWTEAFSKGSHFIGDWSKGSKILFLGPNENGEMGGMVSRIKENKLYEYISIEHLGVVENGKEDTTSDAVKQWAGSLENYTFKNKDGKTELLVDMDINDEYKEMFEGMWPKALQKLKEISEK